MIFCNGQGDIFDPPNEDLLIREIFIAHINFCVEGRLNSGIFLMPGKVIKLWVICLLAQQTNCTTRTLEHQVLVVQVSMQTKIGVKLKSCWSFDRQLWIRHRAHFNYHHVVPDKYYPAAATRPESHFQSPCFTSPTQLSVPSELEERLFRAPVFQSLLKRFTFPSSDHWG